MPFIILALEEKLVIASEDHRGMKLSKIVFHGFVLHS
jgi:hypothetical protein